ncbi:hypothetical protein [Nocardia abscessus]|uniref:hypothetical protein n=1 Tax=Nocardia abscessus TaxID=120957 RepID=UPI0024572BB9|nr:hypothetical protein [Nocardia abscessus]
MTWWRCSTPRARQTFSPRTRELELCLDHDNTTELPGFTLMLRNKHGSPDDLAVTTGFTELLFLDAGVSRAEAARFHLEHIIEVANGVLHLLTCRP